MTKLAKLLPYMLVVLWTVGSYWTAADPAPMLEPLFIQPSKISWGSPPPGYEKALKVCLLTGNPRGDKPFVFRVRMPDGCRIAPHTHPVDEHVTVLSGTLLITVGDKTEELPAGSYVRMPAGVVHSSRARGETVYQIHGVGPYEQKYVK